MSSSMSLNCLLQFQKNHFLYSGEEYVGACNAKKPVFPICHFSALVTPQLSTFHQFDPRSCPPFFCYHARELFSGACNAKKPVFPICHFSALVTPKLSAFHQFDPHSCPPFFFVPSQGSFFGCL